MILAELARGIALRFQRGGERACLGRHADIRARLTHRGQTGADRQLAGDEVRPARRATRFSVVVGEAHAFLGEAHQVRRLAGHDALVVGLDVKPSHVIAHDEKDVRFLVSSLRRSADADGQPEG